MAGTAPETKDSSLPGTKKFAKGPSLAIFGVRTAMASPEGPRIQLLLCSLQIAIKKIKKEGSALLVYREQINTSSCTSKSARPGPNSGS